LASRPQFPGHRKAFYPFLISYCVCHSRPPPFPPASKPAPDLKRNTALTILPPVAVPPLFFFPLVIPSLVYRTASVCFSFPLLFRFLYPGIRRTDIDVPLTNFFLPQRSVFSSSSVRFFLLETRSIRFCLFPSSVVFVLSSYPKRLESFRSMKEAWKKFSVHFSCFF